MKNSIVAWGLILRDVEEKDFERIVCHDGKKPFTKENLIAELDKIDSFPDYTIMPSKCGDVHVVYYGRNSLTENENEKMNEIFQNVFGIFNYI